MNTSPSQVFTPSPPEKIAHTATALEQLDRLLSELGIEHTQDSTSPVSVPLGILHELREVIHHGSQSVANMSAWYESLACAQADAIVHSAEMIDELERTKRSLSDARANAERAATEAQCMADTIFEQTSDGICVFRQRCCIACNDNALKMLDADRSDVVGGWPSAFLSATWEDGGLASEAISEAYDNAQVGKPIQLEVLLPCGEKGHCWVELTVSAIHMHDQEHVLVVIHDINTRKLFEVELGRHRDFLNNIIDAVPDQLSVTTDKSELVLANKAYREAHGINTSQTLAEPKYDASPTTSEGMCFASNEHLMEDGFSDATEQQIQLPNGDSQVLSVRRSLFLGADGEKFIVSASRDITEDRARQDRLRLLASVFNGASEGVAILDSDGQVREANPAFLSMVRTRESQPIGTYLHNLFSFKHDSIYSALTAVTRHGNWAGKGKLRGHASGDRHVWVSMSRSAESPLHQSRIIALFSDITELEQAQTQLLSQALYDNLTGLPNRRFFKEKLQSLISAPNLMPHGLTVCFLDLDDFKHVNDSTGHATGDRLLQSVARRIKETIGDEAFLSRFGGDEFAMILTASEHQPPHLEKHLNRLLAEFRKPFDLEHTEAYVGLSIGVTRWPEQGNNVGTLMCNADIAMYSAKTMGKNRIRFFSPEMEDSVNNRHRIQTMLRQALKESTISPVYQAKVCSKTGKMVACEALARWRTEDGTFISPAEFVPIAEHTGMILQLGNLVFRKAAQQAVKWRRAGRELNIAVNISPNELRNVGFVDQLQKTLEETQAEPSWFELEITEYAMMEDVEHAMKVVHRLSDLGFRIGIDDFGTGYSSLSYLKHFHIHTLKIDRSFVSDITRERKSEAVVHSIVSLGKGLGLSVVAEGVETAEQAALLRQIGCDEMQGYFFGKPMTAEQLEEQLSVSLET